MGMMTRRNVKARAVEAAPLAPVVSEVMAVPKAVTLEDSVRNSGLKRTEINRMTTAELQELAESFGVKEAKSMSGNQIKKMLNAAFEE